MRRLRGGSSSIAMSLKRWIPSLEWDAARTKTYLGAQYRRLARRIGANRPPIAVAHSIAVIIHSIIRTKKPFVDLGHDYFEERDKTAITRRAVRQLERLAIRSPS